MATEVAYYTYIYAKVEREHFQKVTSHTRAAVLAGRAFSSITGQLLIVFNVLDYRQLHYITFSGMMKRLIVNERAEGGVPDNFIIGSIFS